MPKAPTPFLGERTRTDWLPSLLAGAFALVTAVSGFYLTVFLKEQLGYSGAQIGLVFALQAACGVLAAIPAGLGNDRFTSRVLIGASLAVQAAGFLLMAIFRSFLPFLLVYFFWSLANGLFKLSLDVQVLKTDTGTRTASRIGLYQSCRFSGLALGTLATGYLVSSLDFERDLWLSAGACLLLCLFTSGLPRTPVARAKLLDYRMDLTNPRVLFFAAWMFLFSSHWGAESTCYGLFLRNDLGLSLTEMGWYMFAEFVAVVVSLQYRDPRMNDIGKIRGLALAGLVASGLGLVGMVFGPVLVSALFRVLHGIGDGFMFVVLYLGMARLFSIERMGGNAGFISMATMLGLVVGSLIYGPLGESLGYRVPLWVSGLFTLLLAVPLLGFRDKQPGVVDVGT